MRSCASAEKAGNTRENSTTVPPEIRRIERDIEREVRRYQVGVRGGVTLDPELVLIGVQAQFGPLFKSGVYFRPGVDFGLGEVTAMFSLNGDVIYRLPFSSQQDRWSTYIGSGLGKRRLHVLTFQSLDPAASREKPPQVAQARQRYLLTV